MNYIPQRSCVICRTQKNKSELIRIVKNKQKEVKIDLKGKEDGRGAYICYNKKCLEKEIKSKKIERILNIELNEQILQELSKIIENKTGGDIIG